MQQLQSVLDWMQVNPWTTLAIVVYVIANVAPRPNPDKMKGWQKALWQIIDRLCLLTSHKLPGSLKLLLLDSPPHASDGGVEKAPKSQDKPKDDEGDKPDEPEGDEDDDGEDDGDDKDEPAVVVDADGAEEDDEGSDSDGKQPE